jgi:hypothetical protein
MTAEERDRVDAVRRDIQQDLPELKALARAERESREAVRRMLQALKAEREMRGLSLQNIEDATGIGRANLSKLENHDAPNPTVQTLFRYALALGKKVGLRLHDN